MHLEFLAAMVKTVRTANKQINRRQRNKGKCELYHMIEKRSQNT